MVEVAGTGSYNVVPFPQDRKSIDIGDYYADYRKIRSKLGWKPKTDLRKGLTKTLQYFHEHGSHYWTDNNG